MNLGGFLSMYLVCLVLLSLLTPGSLYADDDEHEHHRPASRVSDNPIYADQCGACHIPYRADLLPSGSWSTILSDLHNHNGVEVAIDEEACKTIGPYLEANAADRSCTRMARKIMKSLNGQTPTRVTDVPYIRRKHHEIAPDVFKRESIKSFSNCNACHFTADKGMFDDDTVRIPD